MVIQKKFSINSVKELIILSILSFIMPFSALFTSLLFYKRSWSRYLFVFFCTYFGYTFIIPSSKLLDSGFDSEFYANVLVDYYNSQISFNSFVDGLFTIETSQTDLYQPVVTWIVSRFTADYNVLFAIFGFFFGWFYSKILWFLLDKIKYKFTFFSLALIMMVLLINPLWNINGVRMWTAMEVYIYGVILYFFQNKKKGFFYMVLSIFFHISFVIPFVFFILYWLLPKKKISLLFYIYIVTLFITNLPVEVIYNVSNLFPDFLANRIIGYTNVDYVVNVKENIENTSFFIKMALFSIKTISVIFILFLYFFFLDRIKEKTENIQFYFFIIYTFIWTNIFSIIPSGGRFLTFSYIILFLFILFNYSNYQLNKKFTKLKFVITPMLITYFIYSFRTSMDFQGFPLIFGNFIDPNLFFESIPFINFLK